MITMPIPANFADRVTFMVALAVVIGWPAGGADE